MDAGCISRTIHTRFHAILVMGVVTPLPKERTMSFRRQIVGSKEPCEKGRVQKAC